jgi:putative spermidine/putrescine transport system ATP-binding protein
VSGGALSLKQVSKRYAELNAVDDVSFDVAPGEFVTLLGPSGSGKTTTLRIIAGFIAPSAGGVVLNGRNLTGVAPYKRDIGMVFQNYALFPHMTGGDNIAFPLQMRGVKRAEAARRVEQALELVHLGGLANRYPRQLSGGQQQRVALARAIVFNPSLLLMDEPLGALDKKLREALQLEIMRISRQVGVTVVYVTHDQEEALVMSDRIAIYNQGRIEQQGTGEELYERPASLFVADFVGESNIFRGRLDATGADAAVVRDDWRLRVAPRAPASAGLANGDAAAVVVRPERLRVRAAERAPGSSGAPRDVAANAFPGVVREVIYLGSTRKYVVELRDGTTVQSRVQVGQDSGELAPGSAAEISWTIDSSVLVRDEGPAPATAELEAAAVAGG